MRLKTVNLKTGVRVEKENADNIDPREWNGVNKESNRWQIFNGDAIEYLGKIGENSVDCVVTSPPYFWLRDYGVIHQIGMEDTVDDYVKSICAVMGAIKKVLKKDGLLFLNLGDTYYSGKGEPKGPDRKSAKRRMGLRAVDKSGGLGIGIQRKSLIGIPWRVAIQMSQEGWTLRSPIIWHRVKCLPEPVLDRPSRSYENLFMFSKTSRYYFNKEALIDNDIDEDVWSIPARPKNAPEINTAPFPDELVRRCLLIGCRKNGVVLDPFMGSGTTIRVALALGNDAIGIELNRKYCLYSVKHMGI